MFLKANPLQKKKKKIPFLLPISSELLLTSSSVSLVTATKEPNHVDSYVNHPVDK